MRLIWHGSRTSLQRNTLRLKNEEYFTILYTQFVQLEHNFISQYNDNRYEDNSIAYVGFVTYSLWVY